MTGSFPLEQGRQIRLGFLHRLAHLNQDTFIQLQLVAILDHLLLSPMQIANEISLVIKDHDAFVEGVVAEEAILPAFGFATEIVGVKAAESDDGRGVLGWGDGQAGRAREHDREALEWSLWW